MRRVGEITETVGGLNRNARALSPKYAEPSNPCQIPDHFPALEPAGAAIVQVEASRTSMQSASGINRRPACKSM